MTDGPTTADSTLCPDRSQLVRVWTSRFSCSAKTSVCLGAPPTEGQI